jgi:hypothetical protein
VNTFSDLVSKYDMFTEFSKQLLKITYGLFYITSKREIVPKNVNQIIMATNKQLAFNLDCLFVHKGSLDLFDAFLGLKLHLVDAFRPLK